MVSTSESVLLLAVTHGRVEPACPQALTLQVLLIAALGVLLFILKTLWRAHDATYRSCVIEMHP